MSEFKELKLTDLITSESNPRSEFNEDSLNELAQSIKEHGVLQPIIVRVHPDNSKKFEIVCGERRYRASKIAALKTIPASIRELNDDEVFEIQIVENLERKDVHPMDEAVAFKRMLESGKYTIEDIAAKVAKNTTFVAQRLKLNDLIPELKEDFLKGEFGVGHAVLMCRINEAQQKEIFDDSKSQWNPGYGTVRELKENIDDDGDDLDQALFDTEDAELFPEAGACSSCAKCSLANPILFPEYEERICFDSVCFKTKTLLHQQRNLQEIIDENPGIILFYHYPGKEDEKIISFAESLGKKVYKNWNGYRTVTPTAMNPDPLKAFDLNDWKFSNVKLEGKDISEKSENTEDVLKSEIQNLKSKAARNLELDREKIMQRIYSEIINSEDKNLLTENPFDMDERPSFLLALYEKGNWDFRKWMQDRYEIDRIYSDDCSNYEKLNDLKCLVSNENQIFRAFTVFNLTSNSTFDYERNSFAKGMYEYVKVSYPKEIELYTLEQNAVAEKRIKKSDERIKVLEDELNGKISAVKRCKSCKKSDEDFIEETKYPMMWKGDYCLSCSLKLEKA